MSGNPKASFAVVEDLAMVHMVFGDRVATLTSAEAFDVAEKVYECARAAKMRREGWDGNVVGLRIGGQTVREIDSFHDFLNSRGFEVGAHIEGGKGGA